MKKELLEYHLNYADIKYSNLRKKLEKAINESSNQKSKCVLQFILDRLEKIVIGSVQELIEIQNDYIKMIFQNIKISDLAAFSESHEKLKQIFISTYEDFNGSGIKIDSNGLDIKWNGMMYLKKLNQLVCPYCNASFILTIDSLNHLPKGGLKAKADLDHFIPKSKYPMFAISLYNLVPSCIYCNQRFKRDHNTSFESYYSPFDPDIEEQFKIRINYEMYPKNAFKKLEELELRECNEEVRHYNNLLVKIDNYSDRNKYISEITQNNKDLDELSNELYYVINNSKIKSGKIKELNIILEKVKRLTEIWSEEIKDYHKLMENGKILISQEVYLRVKDSMNVFNIYHRDFIDFNPKKNHREIKTVLNKVKREFTLITEKIEKFQCINLLEEEKTYKEMDFVDITLGKNTNYYIEIIPTSDKKEDQRKVLSNVALFQLEEVYNQFRYYVNRKIEQSYKMNEIYIQSLVNQFPAFLSESNMSDLVDTFLINKETLSQEVLGKLIYDVISPTIRLTNHKDKVKQLHWGENL
ncbi:hypothetical protein [Bacillus cereus]|uniref:hypothetical protein n=1 Tax=Bacillus cereus TaxID=1396 RepID=UPI0018F4803F|nr:hypothetical protein [Bacillus cereus]